MPSQIFWLKMIDINKKLDKSLVKLITPSWLSGLLVILAGLVVTIGVITIFFLQNTTLQQQILGWQSQSYQEITASSQNHGDNDKPTLLNSWPLLVVWGIVGLLVYYVAAFIIGSASKAEKLRESLKYVNANPRESIEAAGELVAMRVLAAIILVILSVRFFDKVLPYAITAARASAIDIISLSGVFYALLSFSAVVVSLHIQVILLRLSLGKIRVFSTL